MPVKFGFSNPLLNAWLVLHQTYNLVSRCEDALFAKEGLTTQQHAVLISIKYINAPVTPTRIAHWLDRNPNSISMIVDRMEKDGLVKRVIRGARDRRLVPLVMTDRGKEVLDHSTVSGWKLVERVLSYLPEDEMRTLASLLEKVRQGAFEYLSPGEIMEEIKVNEAKNMAPFLARVRQRDLAGTGDTEE